MEKRTNKGFNAIYMDGCTQEPEGLKRADTSAWRNERIEMAKTARKIFNRIL